MKKRPEQCFKNNSSPSVHGGAVEVELGGGGADQVQHLVMIMMINIGEQDDHDLTIIMMLMVVKMVNKCMTFIFISNYRREAQSPCSCQSNRNVETQVTPAKSMYAMRPRQSNRTQLAKVITFYSNQFSCARSCKQRKNHHSMFRNDVGRAI